MRRYLLDTNILSELVRHPQGRIAACIAQVGEKQVCTSMIAASELRSGAAKRNASKLTAQVDAFLAAMESAHSISLPIANTRSCAITLNEPARRSGRRYVDRRARSGR